MIKDLEQRKLQSNENRAKHWIITFQREDYHKLTDVILEQFIKANCIYGIYCREQGEHSDIDKDPLHIQAYFIFQKRIRKSYLIQTFPTSHFEIKRGSITDAVNYVKKIDKFVDKKSTQIEEFKEFGILPQEDIKDSIFNLIDNSIKEGLTLEEIRSEYTSQFYRYNQTIEKIYRETRDKYYLSHRRLDLQVNYLYGLTGTGKTRTIMDYYGDDNVYRVVNYNAPWEFYNGQEVIIFEEFRSQIDISDMLNYLDVYGIQLPARYFNKVACYHTVYIVSNWLLVQQYVGVHQNDKLAFYRRIHNVFNSVDQLQNFLKEKSVLENEQIIIEKEKEC